jgi:DNA-binding MarR family transcriptional regulator
MTSVSRGVLALDFMSVLWRLNHALERISLRMEEGLGVTAQQRMMIRWVGMVPGIGTGQLAARLHVDAGTVSAAAARLERKGLLRRRRDERDRRRVMFELTSAGRALDRPTAGTVENAVERLLHAASARDLRATDRTLAALSESLDHETNQTSRGRGRPSNRNPKRR